MQSPTGNSQRDRVLVTGGAGFIGSHLVERLVSLGRDVVIIDDLSTGRRSNLDSVDTKHVKLLEGTVSQRIGELDPSDYCEVYHLAAAVGVRLVIERPIDTININVHETSAVLEFTRPGRTPLLLASTSEVYGKGVRSPFREDDDVVYGPTTLSRWSYACSKAIDEYLSLAYHREHGLPVRVVRFFNTVGPRQVGEYGMVLPRFVRAALANEPLEVHGDGQQSRCFCDVRDVVLQLPVLMSTASCAGRVVNIGNDTPITIAQLAQLVCDTLGSRSEIRVVPYENAFGQGFDDLRHRQPDLTRIRQATGFEPKIPLEQTILDLAVELRRERQGRSAEAEPARLSAEPPSQ